MQLRIENLTKKYRRKVAVSNISTTLECGIYGILGPNGSGKTTFLRMLVNTLEPSAGTIYFDHHSIKDLQEKYREQLGNNHKLLVITQNLRLINSLCILRPVKVCLQALAKKL